MLKPLVPARLSTRIASWEPSTTAPWDALLREDNRQSGADEERGPDVKIFSTLPCRPLPQGT